jgi:hypothetical protein
VSAPRSARSFVLFILLFVFPLLCAHSLLGKKKNSSVLDGDVVTQFDPDYFAANGFPSSCVTRWPLWPYRENVDG